MLIGWPRNHQVDSHVAKSPLEIPRIHLLMSQEHCIKLHLHQHSDLIILRKIIFVWSPHAISKGSIIPPHPIHMQCGFPHDPIETRIYQKLTVDS